MGFFRRILSDQANTAKAVGRAAVAPGLPLSGPSTNSPSCLSNLPPFRYTPLISPTAQFRILHLRPTSADLVTPWDSILLRGTLVTAPIDAPPEYYALSYCWGDASPVESIVVDGAVLRITASCAAALRRMLRGKSGGRMIWVDSICINQASDVAALAERGAQVAMMDRIYRGAVQVNVHLGEGDASTEAACEAVRKLTQYAVGAMMPGFLSGGFVKKYEALVEDVLACTAEYPHGKLYGLFRQPWFERYWVIQEVVLASDVNFYCGKYVLLLPTIITATNFSRLPPSKLESSLTAAHWRQYTEYYTSAQTWIRQRENPSATPKLPHPTLAQVIVPPALIFDATRPEDKVHALYGICKRLGYDLPSPDYTKTLAQVYTETAQAILRYDGEQGLDELLESACESQSGLDHGIPSWVPNLAGCLRKWSFSNPPNLYLNDRTNTWPSGRENLGCQFELDTDSSILRVKGRRLGIVCETGMPWAIDNSTNLFGRAPLPTGSHIFALLNCLESWLAIAFHSMNVTSPSQAPAAGLRLAELLAKDTTGSPSQQELQVLAQYLALAMTLSKMSNDPMRLILADPQNDSRQQELIPYGKNVFLSKGMYAALEKIFMMGWKTVFRTAQGFLGVGPHSVRDGDTVVVFQGCSMAGLVRPWGDGFRYVGPAYVLGVMHGEFWETGDRVDDEWFALV